MKSIDKIYLYIVHETTQTQVGAQYQDLFLFLVVVAVALLCSNDEKRRKYNNMK